MQVPAEFRCCICLSVPREPVKSGCTHRLCKSCAETGKLQSCPVCTVALATVLQVDEDLVCESATKRLRCECGEEVALIDADVHECEQTRKQEQDSVAVARREGAAAPGPNRSTFACPLCKEPNLSMQGLVEHCESKHAGCCKAAVCPVCASMPWGDPTYVSRDFVSHVRLRHRCDYAVLADFEVDEEEMVRRALAESARDAGLPDAEDAELQRILEESARDAAAARLSSATVQEEEEREEGDEELADNNGG